MPRTKKNVQLEQELQAKDVANAKDKINIQLEQELQAQELQAKDATNAKDKKIVQLEQELQAKDVVGARSSIFDPQNKAYTILVS
jgi:hypothetical protein